jgi:hypothetical protein
VPARGRHEAEPNACGYRQQKEPQLSKSLQLSKFKADSSAKNTIFEQKSAPSSNFAKNLSFDQIWKLTYI